MKRKSGILLAILLLLFSLLSCSKTSFHVVLHYDNNRPQERIVFSKDLMLPTPNKVGYRFQGWYLDTAFQVPFYADDYLDYRSDRDVHLYAKWEIIESLLEMFILNPYDNENAFLALRPKERIVDFYFGNVSFVLTSEGRLFSWGSNFYGQVGDGTTQNRHQPFELSTVFAFDNKETIGTFTTSGLTSALLTTTGRLFIWGYNRYGQLGNGSSSEFVLTPTEVTPFVGVTEEETITTVFLKGESVLILTSNNRIFTWGNNQFGQLGDGTYLDRSTPVDITPRLSLQSNEIITHIAYDSRALIATSHNRVFFWGSSDFPNSNQSFYPEFSLIQNTPYEITHLFEFGLEETIQEISSSTSLLTSKGRLFVWGYNSYGQIGNGTTSVHYHPVDITSSFNLINDEIIIKTVFSGMNSFAMTSMNRLFAWGENGYGQLGTLTTSPIYTGVLLPIDITKNIPLLHRESITNLSASGTHSQVYTSYGRLLVWGEDIFGLSNSEDPDRFILNPTSLSMYDFLIHESTILPYHSPLLRDSWIPQKQGYQFAGWFIDEPMTIPFEQNVMPPNELKLYGYWIKVE